MRCEIDRWKRRGFSSTHAWMPVVSTKESMMEHTCALHTGRSIDVAISLLVVRVATSSFLMIPSVARLSSRYTLPRRHLTTIVDIHVAFFKVPHHRITSLESFD